MRTGGFQMPLVTLASLQGTVPGPADVTDVTEKSRRREHVLADDVRNE
jgi:hypothetical protein